ncbi:TonB-dependent receptor [Aurantiacibacter sediminis]|uniref:TonB-dependent receptor n=1 Tax=Aurantiacibacter sediminis TaxID=2793064 RepID=A0ABS0N6T1_9SPHN|nr:TonB-dependent receptor [Aurantiacibacter sediminis]MBH5323473.1 TonB-dependent receptor [Aurantiacibacter sediminis]
MTHTSERARPRAIKLRNAAMILGASALALAMPYAAAAQEQIPGENVEQAEPQADNDNVIIVTAQRREQSLQEVPIAVTAVSGEELAARSAIDVSDIAQFTPSVTIQGASRSSGGGTNAAIFVRGIGQDEFLITFDPGVGIYIDGIYLGRTTGSILDLADLERIEVLRGPQGTLFGRNSVGGAIQIVSRKPELGVVEGFGSIGIREDDGFDISGALNVPLGDNIAFRVTGQHRQQDGFAINQTTGNDLSNVDRQVVRAQLLIEPTDRLSALFSADASFLNERGIQSSLVDLDTNSSFLQLFNGFSSPPGGPLAIDGTDVARDPDVSNLNRDGLNENTAFGFSATLEYELTDTLTVKSLSSYRDLASDFTADLDGTDAPFVDNFYSTRQNQFSQELQLLGTAFDDRLNFTVGAFYFREEAAETGQIDIFAGLFNLFQGLPGPIIPAFPGVDCTVTPQFCGGGANNPVNANFDLQFRTDSVVEVDSYALFGQFEYELTDRLTAIVGLRQSWDTKTLDYNVTRGGGSAAFCALPFGGAVGCIGNDIFAVPPTQFSDTFRAFTPRFGLNYDFSPDVFGYASVARGYKSGGFNGRATTLNDLTIFAPEDVWTYETGLRTTLAGGDIILNGAVYYSDYQDIQFAIAVPNPAGPGTLSPVINAGSAEIYGLELEGTARLTDTVRLSGGASFISAEYTEDVTFLGQPTGILNGNDVPKTPSTQLFGSIDYRQPVANNRFLIHARVDGSYRSSIQNEPSNFAPVSQDGYGIINARLGFGDADETYDLSIWAKNLFDERYLENGFRSGGGTNIGYFARGRQIGATLRFSF